MKKEFKDWLATPVNEEDFVADLLGRMKPLSSAEVAFNYAYQLRQAEADALRAENERLRKDADRLKGLRKLMGYVEDGSHDTVRLNQDDATYSFSVTVGKRSFYGDSFWQAIDAAIKTLEGE